MDICNVVSINRIKINRKKIITPFNLFFFILLIKKWFETLSKHSAQSLYYPNIIYCFELIYFCSINNQETVVSITV